MRLNAFPFILAIVLLTLSTPAATRISVGGQYDGEFGPTLVTFQGVQQRDGTFVGQYEQHNPEIDLSIHADMDCVVPLGAGRAIASGVITRVKQAGAGWEDVVAGTRIIVAVVDGGEKRGSVDLVSVWWEIPSWATCDQIAQVAVAWYEFFRDFGFLAPLRGNVQVAP